MWELGHDLSFWKDFYISNGIKMVVFPNSSAKQILASLALAETGGLSVEMERTLQYDYCTYLHNFPSHVKFVTGPYSLTQIPEPFFCRWILDCGPLRSGPLERLLEDRSPGRGARTFVISLFDEIPGDWFFGDSIQQMYEVMIHLVRTDKRFFLQVKTKKNQVLERLRDVKTELLDLQEKGAVKLLDWKVSVSSAASSSDVAVSVPSTAVFESLLTGTPTLVFNPMRAGMRIFYRSSGLNRRIFEDPGDLMDGLKRLAAGDRTIGDCRDLLPQFDSFQDGLGAQRIGKYIQKCLAGFDDGKVGEDILLDVNRWYAEKWGENKILENRT